MYPLNALTRDLAAFIDTTLDMMQDLHDEANACIGVAVGEGAKRSSSRSHGMTKEILWVWKRNMNLQDSSILFWIITRVGEVKREKKAEFMK